MRIEDEIDLLVKQMKAMRTSNNVNLEKPHDEKVHIGDSIQIVEIPKEDSCEDVEEDHLSPEETSDLNDLEIEDIIINEESSEEQGNMPEINDSEENNE